MSNDKPKKSFLNQFKELKDNLGDVSADLKKGIKDFNDGKHLVPPELVEKYGEPIGSAVFTGKQIILFSKGYVFVGFSLGKIKKDPEKLMPDAFSRDILDQRLQEGIKPRRPISTTVSDELVLISKIPFPLTSFHSKLLLMESDMTAVISPVSFAEIVSGETNCPVTPHEPCGMGELAKFGLGTVVAPGGACPENTCPTVSKPQ